MNRQKKDDYLVFVSIIFFLVIEIVKFLELVPPNKWKDFEVVCNIILLLIAMIEFFGVGLPAQMGGKPKINVLLANLAISWVAFWVNIDVFGHVIRFDHFFSDLQGWHFGWLICAIVQIVFLTGLGAIIKLFMEKIVTACAAFCSFIVGCGKALLAPVGQCDKGIIVIYILSALVWLFYTGYSVSKLESYDVWGISQIFMQSVVIWGSCLTIGFLAYVAKSFFLKGKKAVIQMDNKRVLTIAGTVIALIISYWILSVLLGVLAIVIYIITFLLFIALNSEKNRRLAEEKTGEQSVDYHKYCKYWFVFCLMTVVFPLLILFALTVSGRGEQISLADLSTMATNILSLLVEFIF